MNTREKLIWAAGLFEGEGTIYIHSYKRKNGNMSYQLTMAVTMTDEDCVKNFSETIGGWFGNHHLREDINDKRKRSWVCCLSGPRASKAINSMLPFFQSQRSIDRAKLAIEFQNQVLKGTPARNLEYKQKQKEYYKQMKELNKRGKVT